MKKIISILVIALAFTITSNAQDKRKTETKAPVVSLEQTKGEFTQKNITLTEGNYIFEISNNNVGHQVGFVLVPKGKDASNAENHNKTAYVTKAADNNTKENS